jgi:NADH-quinone oxidoreductase subunit L
MLLPLVILAVCSVVAGFLGVPAVLGGGNPIEHFLTPASLEAAGEVHESHALEIALMAASTAAALAGLFLAYLFYVARPALPAKMAAKAHAMYSIMLNKYYVDELYDTFLVWPIVRASREFLWKFVDVSMIDGAVNGVGALVRGSAGGLRRMQSGYVRTYIGWIVLGGVLIMAWFLR